MKYMKPEVQCLAEAAKTIQSGSKGSQLTTDSMFPYTTTSAYEADE